MKLSDLATITQLYEAREYILRMKKKVEDGEDITLTIGDENVPITKDDIKVAACYQLNQHFDKELEAVDDQLKALDVVIDD